MSFNNNNINPESWGVTDEVFNDSTRHLVRSPVMKATSGEDVATSLQPAGIPVDQRIFKSRINKPNTRNPCSVQRISFGALTARLLNSVDPDYQLGGLSDVSISAYGGSFVCFAYGGSSYNDTQNMGDSGYGGQNLGDMSAQNGSTLTVLNNTRNYVSNGSRWYSNSTQAGLNATTYGYRPYVKFDRNYAVVTADILAMKRVVEDGIYTDISDLEVKRFTLDEYFHNSENQQAYPLIIKVYVKLYALTQGTGTRQQIFQAGIFRDVDVNADDDFKNYQVVDPYVYAGEAEIIPTKDGLNGYTSPSGISKTRGYIFSNTIYDGTVFVSPSTDLSLRRNTLFSKGINSHSVISCLYRQVTDTYTYNRPVRVIHFAGTLSDIITALSDLGVPYTTYEDAARNGDIINDPRIHVPRYGEDGTVKDIADTPEEKEEELTDNPLDAGGDPDSWGADGDPSEDPDDPGFDPDEDPEKDKEKDKIEMPVPTLGTVGVFNRCYAVNAEELQALSNYLWNVDETTFDTILKGLQLIGVNPIDAIISVIMFPFEIATGSTSRIRIGVVDTEVTGVPINYNSVQVFDLGTCYFYRKYKNYLDYEPYTTASLYIPFVGIIPISVAEFTKKYINVKIAVDLLTGSGQVVVYADGIPAIYRNCKIGCQIAVTGQDSSRIASNYINAVSELASGVTGVAGGIASGNAMGAIGSAASLAKGGLDFYTAGNVPIESRGCDSPQCGFFMPQRCYLIVNRPRVYEINESIYAKSVGIACYETGSVGSFHGFSKFENVKLDISVATEEEKAQIKSLLASGVYLP